MFQTDALSIMLLSTEAVPFAKAGGLAEAVPPLARALAERGHDVRLMLPRYYFVDRSQLQATGLVLSLPFQGQTVHFQAYRSALPNSAVPVYFIEAEEYFGRDGIYGDADNQEFTDNPTRFAFFCRASLALCRAMQWIPDIIQAHDWPCSPALAFLALEENRTEFARTRGVLAIHNIAYQGIFGADEFHNLELDGQHFQPGCFEFFGRLNFLQGAIRHSHAITTVSPSYADEIITSPYGFGLEGILYQRRGILRGILNGLDYQVWDPRHDPSLTAAFDHDELAGKARCKAALQAAFGLPVSADIPLIALVSRLIGQKGFVELLAPGCLPRLLAEEQLQLVVMGSGQAWCEEAIWKLSRQFPNLAFYQGYAESKVHQILAGSDFLLMPSLIEPCGLSQMAALRYGAVPLVPKLGGLADTVRVSEDAKEATRQPATGLAIELPLGPDTIHRAVRTALDAWHHDAPGLSAMRQRGMLTRFSWDAAAKAYEGVFRDCLVDPQPA